MGDNQNFNRDEIDNLIRGALSRGVEDDFFNFRERFENRVKELEIKAFQIEKNLGIEYKTLNRIIDGDIKKYDLVALIKIGSFLGINEKEISGAFTRLLANQHSEEIEHAKKTTFILDNFDLPTLKDIGAINTTVDFVQIEKKLNSIFGLKSILDYNTEESGAAFSSTTGIEKAISKTKSAKNRKYFIDKSKTIFKLINNPNKYQRELLIEYFPKIRWHSTDLDNGLINVIKSMYSLGVTVIFQPKIPSLKMRGATFEANKKPCIVLTDYRQSYPTLWFALLHELFHVLFDWDEIYNKTYHLSEEDNDLFILKHKEEEANDFAREYLFPKNKIEEISDRITQNYFVREYAFDHHIHPSILYANYSYVNNSEKNNLWAKFDTFIRPPMDKLTNKLTGGLSHDNTSEEICNYYNTKIYASNE